MDKLTTDQFIEKAKIIHGSTYDYSKSSYIKSDVPVDIGCHAHGIFRQKPTYHLSGSGCPTCGKLKTKSDNYMGLSKFIERSVVVHGGFYTYNNAEYVNSITPLQITCPLHGNFMQIPKSHLKGHGCSRCRADSIVSWAGLGEEEFIQRAIQIHGNIYNYSSVVYRGIRVKVSIGCPLHGEFKQTPSIHLRGCGCPKCGKIKKVAGIQSNTSKFINKAISIHGDKYDYSCSVYIKSALSIEINCREHGVFTITPNMHLRGYGCPKCSAPSGEVRCMGILDKYSIEYVHQKRFHDCRFKKVLSFDFYIPHIRTCIEFNGKQHYEPIEYFGGVDAFKRQIDRDKIKAEYCIDNNIRLCIIPYWSVGTIEKIFKELKILPD